MGIRPHVADAEDIVQQTALALWEKFDAYDSSQAFTPWACRFALNKTKQWIERRQRWQALLEAGPTAGGWRLHNALNI